MKAKLTQSKYCRGTMYNGPGKRYARCGTCGRIDWEKNEGDRCNRPQPEDAQKLDQLSEET